MKYLIIILINISVLSLSAQYTYFNQTYGEFGDQETEHMTNVEVVGDTIYMFGGIDNDEDPFSFLLRAIDMEGNLLIEKTVPMPYLAYIGYGEAVSKTNSNNFIFTQGNSEGESFGLAILYDNNLDTLWMRTYNNVVSSSTYFRSNTVDETGIIVLGDDFSESNQTGTFILKLDFEGNIVWFNLLHDQSEGHVYQNDNILVLDDGYLIGGHKQGPWTSILTKTDQEGNIEWEYYADNFEDIEGDQASTVWYRLAQLPNGEIVGAHMVYYEYYGPTSIPNTNPLWYRSLHLSKINVADTSMYWEHDYFTDHEFSGSNLWKILPTEDNGIIAMGTNGVYAQNTWVAKIDSSGILDWFNFYTLDISQTQETYGAFDIETTSDGGYVVVGEYFSNNIDNFNKSWVMKIDACGDVEWQGCDYVGIQERIKNKFKIYPNPATEYVMIEGDFSPKASIMVYDMLGNVVVNQPLSYTGKVDLTGLNKGMYSLMMVDEGERRFVGKVVVE